VTFGWKSGLEQGLDRPFFSFIGMGRKAIMKKHLVVVVVALSVFAAVAPALAWEFDLKGEYENRFRYFGRTGDTDLFGTVPLQEANVDPNTGGSVFIGFAGPNIYGTGNLASVPGDAANASNPALAQILADPPVGVITPANNSSMVITRGGFSRWGSDAIYNDSKFTLRPVFKLNPAVKIFGVYTIGGMRNKYKQNNVSDYVSTTASIQGGGSLGSSALGAAPLERYYMSQTSMNAYDGTFGTWEQFRLTATLPWGVWSIGVKDFPFGTGATLGHNTRAEEALWVVPYGPFRLLGAVWLARGRFLESWGTVPDRDTKPTLFNGFAVTYDAGELSLGALTIWRQYHRNRGALPIVSAGSYAWLPNGSQVVGYYNIPNNNAAYNISQSSLDENSLINLVFFKYNNGRFFANGEYSWVNIDQYTPTPTFTGGTGTLPVHIEAYHAFAEAGCYGGPAKLTLMYALSSGPVLNNPNPTKVYGAYPINYQAMEAYEFLMFNTFAGGNNGGWNATDVTFVSDEHGMMQDAYAYAARLDYAAAANLNVYGSYIWAHRLERAGFLNGLIRDTGNGGQYAINNVLPGRPFLAQYGGTTAYVPDGFIGWEANAGVDWKLLENLTFRARYSYWKPGQWFDYAYQAWGYLPGGGAPTDGVIVKGRSAINAFQASIVAEF
jgi:hypothetical protein